MKNVIAVLLLASAPVFASGAGPTTLAIAKKLARAFASAHGSSIDARCAIESGDGWVFPYGAEWNASLRECEGGSDHYGVTVYPQEDGSFVVGEVDA